MESPPRIINDTELKIIKVAISRTISSTNSITEGSENEFENIASILEAELSELKAELSELKNSYPNIEITRDKLLCATVDTISQAPSSLNEARRIITAISYQYPALKTTPFQLKTLPQQALEEKIAELNKLKEEGISRSPKLRKRSKSISDLVRKFRVKVESFSSPQMTRKALSRPAKREDSLKRIDELLQDNAVWSKEHLAEFKSIMNSFKECDQLTETFSESQKYLQKSAELLELIDQVKNAQSVSDQSQDGENIMHALFKQIALSYEGVVDEVKKQNLNLRTCIINFIKGVIGLGSNQPSRAILEKMVSNNPLIPLLLSHKNTAGLNPIESASSLAQSLSILGMSSDDENREVIIDSFSQAISLIAKRSDVFNVIIGAIESNPEKEDWRKGVLSSEKGRISDIYTQDQNAKLPSKQDFSVEKGLTAEEIEELYATIQPRTPPPVPPRSQSPLYQIPVPLENKESSRPSSSASTPEPKVPEPDPNERQL